jgi:hypothetical protein
LNSVKFLTDAGIEWDFYNLAGDSYVDRAKNSLVHKFLESDATHIMLIDSDMEWEVNGFGRIIKAALAGFELVGAAYPCKNNWQFFGCIPKLSEDGQYMGKEVGDIRLMDMWGIPGGFIIYDREAFERARPNLNTYTDNEGTEFLECFRCNVESNKTRIGEDIYFQQRYKEMGGIVWMDPDITLRHWGVKAWEGNYQDYIMKGIEAKEVED